MAELEDKAAETPPETAVAETAVAETAAAATVPAAPTDEDLPRGTAIQRYLVLDRIGAGAMGVVYAAHDRELDRNIALKLVRDPRRGTALRRLLREAQALAQLSHPNVVAVFDVGTFRDQVFLAMELVSGQTLRSWMEERPRAWREVVEVYRSAGEGLAAAHAAGVVHRDFKPDNVLIDASGRVRVADFGLALVDRAGEEDGPGSESSGDDEMRATDPGALTATGAVIGTPAYMAPEQRSGCMPVGPRADQFSFCVSLYEALCGERPFDLSHGEGAHASASPFAGELDRARPGAAPGAAAARRLPRRLRRLLARGLATDPEDRHPSMDALLADLGRDPIVRRRRVALVAGAATVAAAAALLFGVGRRGDGEQICQGAAGRLAGVWDGARKQAVQSAFRASGSPMAQSGWTGVERVIDGWSASWARAYTEACEATHVRGEQPPALLDLKMECLDRRRTELGALVDLFAAPGLDAETVRGAVMAALSLPSLAVCADDEALREEGQSPADPAQVARIAEVRQRLAAVYAQIKTGKYKDALAPSRRVSADAAAIGYRPLEAEALLRQSQAEARTYEIAAAEETLYRAISAAQAGRQARLATRAWLDLCELVGDTDKRHEEGLRLCHLARASLERLGGDALLESELEVQIGSLHHGQGKRAEARAHLEKSLALAEKAPGAEPFDTAEPIQQLAMLAEAEGDYEEALALHRRVTSLLEEKVGSEHPVIAVTLIGEGTALYNLNRPDEALQVEYRALGLAERTVGPMSEEVAVLLNNIGLILQDQRDFDGALDYFERVLRIYDHIYGPDHLNHANTLANIGNMLIKMKRFPDAIARFERARSLYEASVGPEHQDVAMALTGLGGAHLEAGHTAPAVEALERAVAIQEKVGADPIDRGSTEFELAKALWKSGRDRPRADRLAASARARFEKARYPESARRVTDWIESRRRGTGGK